MSIHGKRDSFTLSDLKVPATEYDIRDAAKIREEVAEAVAMWPKFARLAGVDTRMSGTVGATHLFRIVSGK
jgi:hypothetical protein